MLKLTRDEIDHTYYISHPEGQKEWEGIITNLATSKVCWKLWQILMELGYRAAARKVKAILEAEGIEKWREG